MQKVKYFKLWKLEKFQNNEFFELPYIPQNLVLYYKTTYYKTTKYKTSEYKTTEYKSGCHNTKMAPNIAPLFYSFDRGGGGLTGQSLKNIRHYWQMIEELKSNERNKI